MRIVRSYRECLRIDRPDRLYHNLSVGQVNDAFAKLGKTPTDADRAKYTSDSSLDGSGGQQKLIASLGGGTGGNPSGGGNSSVDQYLAQFNSDLMTARQAASDPGKTDDQILAEVKQNLTGNLPALPTAPNMAQTYQTLMGSSDIQSLETQLTSLKADANTIQNNQEATQASEEGKPVAQNVISGRETEEQRQARVKLDANTRQQQLITDQLSQKYTMVSNIMQFMQTDYSNAVQEYNTQFQTNTAIYDAFNSQKQIQTQNKQQALSTVLSGDQTNVSVAQQEEQFQYQQAQDTIKNATANLQIMTNLITSGSLDYNKLSSDQKLQIQKLEVQSGLGTGFVQSVLNSNPQGKVLYAGKNGVVFQMPDGSIKTQSYNDVSGSGTGNNSGYGNALSPKEDKAIIQRYDAALSGIANSGNNQQHVDPDTYNAAKADYVNHGGTEAEFNSKFKHYADPNRGDYPQAYGL